MMMRMNIENPLHGSLRPSKTDRTTYNDAMPPIRRYEEGDITALRSSATPRDAGTWLGHLKCDNSSLVALHRHRQQHCKKNMKEKKKAVCARMFFPVVLPAAIGRDTIHALCSLSPSCSRLCGGLGVFTSNTTPTVTKQCADFNTLICLFSH
ncbi:unnamed protein product [Lampetra planeri]